MVASSSSSSSATSMITGLITPRQHQVFINFRGDVRTGFISHLETALDNEKIIYYIDRKEVRGEPIEILFDRIDESDIALAIFSKRYSDSKWCLNELVRIMQNVKEKKLRVIPIFFDVEINDVKYQEGDFGLNFHKEHRSEKPHIIESWKKALESATTKMALKLTDFSSESHFIAKIVVDINEVIGIIDKGDGTNGLSNNTSSLSSNGDTSSRDFNQHKVAPLSYGMQHCLEKLEEKLDFYSEETQIVGIVGMPGIGKTALANLHYNKSSWRYTYSKVFQGFRDKSKEHDWVKTILESVQSDRQDGEMVKSFVILDDVSDKQQIEFLQMNRERIVKEGSKILITTRDKGLIEELVQDTYVVPPMNDKEAFQLFTYHAFDDHDQTPTENFINMSKMFVDYAGGNPLALVELGKEICGKEEVDWKRRLETLPHCCNKNIGRELRISYDELTEKQKDAFLDIACFFRSEEEDYVRVLLDSYDTNSGESAREVTDLANKFLISISAGRIEMHNILCTLGKEIGSSEENSLGKSRLWNHKDALDALLFEKRANSARGILLDTSKIAMGYSLKRQALTKMRNLRYFKIFDSRCPRQCEVVDCKINLPDGLQLPLKEIRYLHWLKFSEKELPEDFNPENLIDLRLPYSKIQRVWSTTKDTPNLKWVDLSHSTRLIDLSALKNVESLRRLNLEGCTMLVELPAEMENMKNLVFLNLRRCENLVFLPNMKNFVSLKTLILSACSKFKEFHVFSENLEYLHLDGTAIEGLPQTIQELARLIVLNLKDCKKLESLPDCLDKLKALEELILSGCSKLESLPDVKEGMESLQILLLDRTSIKELPNGLLHFGNNSIDIHRKRPRMNGLSLLRRLCLSRNDKIISLQFSISELHHLKWIDLKYCNNLTSLSTLPPNLQCLDAHACISLKKVARPLAVLFPLTEKAPSSFIFTNCDKLDNVSKNEFICYAHNKSRLVSDALNRQNKDLAFEALVSTCFPGSEVPSWFNHRASGAQLELELPGHWSESGFVGIALCVIVSFQDDFKIQNNNLMVKCKCEFCNVVGTSSSSCFFNCSLGGLSEAGDEQRTINSTHVFIGFTSWLDIKKCQEDGVKKRCIPTKASIKFEVTDDTCEAANCEVLKCGFSLVCESDHGSWDVNTDASARVSESGNGSQDANGARPMVSESGNGSRDANDASPMVSESGNGSRDANDASPMVSESGNGSRDANADANLVAERVKRGENRFLGLLRSRGWFFTP